MKKLHKLFLSAYIGPFLVTLMVVLFFLVMQFLWKYMDDMIGKGLELYLIGKLLFFASANLVPMALPLAVLLASIMTFGNFAEHFELTAIKSAGISLQKSMRPLILFSLFVALSSFLFMNYVWPVANLKMKTLLYDITHKKPALEIREKQFYKEIDGYIIRVEQKSDDQQVLYGVSIYDHTEQKGNNKIIRADSGKMTFSNDEKHMIFELYNGTVYHENAKKKQQKKSYIVSRTKFEKQKVLFDLSSFEMKKTEEDLFKDNYEMLSLRQLSNGIDSTEKQIQNASEKFNHFITAQTNLLKLSEDSILALKVAPKDHALTKNFIQLDYFKKLHILEINPLDQKQLIKNQLKLIRNAKSYASASENGNKHQISKINRYKIEWHRKFSIAYMTLVLFFIGAPLGAITKKGGIGLPVLISVVFFIFYYVIGMVGEKLIKQGSLEALQGMWLSSIVLTPIALFLTYKATKDSQIFNIEAYTRFFSKFKPQS